MLFYHICEKQKKIEFTLQFNKKKNWIYYEVISYSAVNLLLISIIFYSVNVNK
jgi:hypothetical protein